MSLTRRQLVSRGLTAAGVGLAALHTLQRTAKAHDDHDTPMPAPGSEPLRVQVAIFDGFQLTDALGPFDVLSVLEKRVGEGAPLQTTLVTVNGSERATALANVSVAATAELDLDADVLIVPGGPELWRAGKVPEGLEAAMQAFRAPGKILAPVCTGGVFAARAGHFKGRHATTHKNALTVIEELGAILSPGRVVDDGDLISSGGSTSGYDLALYLVERVAGADLALQLEQIFEYERRGTVWRS